MVIEESVLDFTYCFSYAIDRGRCTAIEFEKFLLRNYWKIKMPSLFKKLLLFLRNLIVNCL